nr:MAG TPA: hypothetical protein [Caudoviricetes sp.]
MAQLRCLWAYYTPTHLIFDIHLVFFANLVTRYHHFPLKNILVYKCVYRCYRCV